MVVTAQSIRYRRELQLWQEYDISTRLAGWSDVDKCFYLESTFLTKSEPDSPPFIHAIHWVKYRLIGETKDSNVLPSSVLFECKVISSPITYFLTNEAIERWNKANEISSHNLRALSDKIH